MNVPGPLCFLAVSPRSKIPLVVFSAPPVFRAFVFLSGFRGLHGIFSFGKISLFLRLPGLLWLHGILHLSLFRGILPDPGPGGIDIYPKISLIFRLIGPFAGLILMVSLFPGLFMGGFALCCPLGYSLPGLT